MVSDWNMSEYNRKKILGKINFKVSRGRLPKFLLNTILQLLVISFFLNKFTFYSIYKYAKPKY